MPQVLLPRWHGPSPLWTATAKMPQVLLPHRYDASPLQTAATAQLLPPRQRAGLPQQQQQHAPYQCHESA